jgi:manganese/zinc/iron transport system substrate-binding protein
MLKTLALMFIFLVGCTSFDGGRVKAVKAFAEKNGKLKILCSTAMIEDLVKEIGGDEVDTITLIQGDIDPHSYQLVKGDGELFEMADLVFFNGLKLEHGPSWTLYLAEKKSISLGGEVEKKSPEKILVDDSGEKDPHFWMDISLFMETIPFIKEAIVSKRGDLKELVEARSEALFKKMEKTHENLVAKMHTLEQSKRFLVTSHDAFNYFARAYLAEKEEIPLGTWHKRFAAPEGLAPDSHLSFADIKEIIDHLKMYNIPVLFAESNVSQESIKKIVSAGNEMGLKVKIAKTPLFGDAMGPKGSSGDTYLKMIEHNVNTIVKTLGDLSGE